jgi:hypothetical protein
MHVVAQVVSVDEMLQGICVHAIQVVCSGPFIKLLHFAVLERRLPIAADFEPKFFALLFVVSVRIL